MGAKRVIRTTGTLAGLGERLRRAREDAEVTQEEAALAIGTTTRSIRRFERGEYEPSMGQLAALARFYEVSSDSILYDDESRAA
jgi:transcriptional regulator with XRE-family HTH domain